MSREEWQGIPPVEVCKLDPEAFAGVTKMDYLCWCRCGHSDKDHLWGETKVLEDGSGLAKLGRCRKCRFPHRCKGFKDSGQPLTLVPVPPPH